MGYALPGVELKIIDIVDGPTESIEETSQLPTGQVGEILVRGKHVSPEYYLDPESTRKNKVPDPQGTGTASGMSAISTRRTGSGSAAGCHSG